MPGCTGPQGNAALRPAALWWSGRCGNRVAPCVFWHSKLSSAAATAQRVSLRVVVAWLDGCSPAVSLPDFGRTMIFPVFHSRRKCAVRSIPLYWRVTLVTLSLLCNRLIASVVTPSRPSALRSERWLVTRRTSAEVMNKSPPTPLAPA